MLQAESIDRSSHKIVRFGNKSEKSSLKEFDKMIYLLGILVKKEEGGNLNTIIKS